jgi:hypothetical protein
MVSLNDQQSELLCGGRLSITVAPSISVNTAITNALQGNLGGSFAVGLLGGSASSDLFQLNQLGLSMALF